MQPTWRVDAKQAHAGAAKVQRVAIHNLQNNLGAAHASLRTSRRELYQCRRCEKRGEGSCRHGLQLRSS